MDKNIQQMPPRFSITAAADLLGMSRQNLHKTYIKSGQLSIQKDSQNKPYIDLSELLRVFPHVKIATNTVATQLENTESSHQHASEIDALKSELSKMSDLLQAERKRADLAEERELWARSMADKALDTVKLLENKIQPKTEQRNWLSRFFTK